MNVSGLFPIIMLALFWFLSAAAKNAKRQNAENAGRDGHSPGQGAPGRPGAPRQMRPHTPRPGTLRQTQPYPVRQSGSYREDPFSPARLEREYESKSPQRSGRYAHGGTIREETLMEREGYSLGEGGATIKDVSLFEREGYEVGSGGYTIRDSSLMEREGYSHGEGGATIRDVSLFEREGYIVGEGRGTIAGDCIIEQEGYSLEGSGSEEGISYEGDFSWRPAAPDPAHAQQSGHKPGPALDQLIPLHGEELLKGIVFSEILSRRTAGKFR